MWYYNIKITINNKIIGGLTMRWIKVKIYTTTEGIEPLTAMLMEIGITGIQVEDDDELKQFVTTSSSYWDYVDEELLNKEKEDTRVTVYVSDNPYGMDILMSLKEGLYRLKNSNIGVNLGKLTYELTNTNDKDWLDKWKEFYKPFNVGEKIIVRPEWEKIDNPEKRIVFNINPGHIFGTGMHQTTQLCIVNLEKYVEEDSEVLDLGCGSGILSIISLLLGARHANAVDIDENAIKTAYENAALNNIEKDRYYVTSGNIIDNKELQDEIGYEKYDIIVANIIADIIISMLPSIKRAIKKDGIFISSGIIKDRINDVKIALEETGFKVIDTSIKDEWVSITAKLK